MPEEQFPIFNARQQGIPVVLQSSRNKAVLLMLSTHRAAPFNSRLNQIVSTSAQAISLTLVFNHFTLVFMQRNRILMPLSTGTTILLHSGNWVSFLEVKQQLIRPSDFRYIVSGSWLKDIDIYAKTDETGSSVIIYLLNSIRSPF